MIHEVVDHWRLGLLIPLMTSQLYLDETQSNLEFCLMFYFLMFLMSIMSIYIISLLHPIMKTPPMYTKSHCTSRWWCIIAGTHACLNPVYIVFHYTWEWFLISTCIAEFQEKNHQKYCESIVFILGISNPVWFVFLWIVLANSAVRTVKLTCKAKHWIQQIWTVSKLYFKAILIRQFCCPKCTRIVLK